MSTADDPTEAAQGAPTAAEPGLRGDLDGDGHLDAHERFHLLRDAAIEAEYATGRHEETEAEAKRLGGGKSSGMQRESVSQKHLQN